MHRFWQERDRLTPDRQVSRIIKEVRNRWRIKVALRGLAITATAGLVVFLVASYGMDYFRFSPASVTVFRVLAYGLVGILSVKFLMLPLLRRLPDQQVALYLEEIEPSLDAHWVSAVELTHNPELHGEIAPAIKNRLVESAVARVGEVEQGRRVERPSIARSSALLAGTAVVGMILALSSPGFVHNSSPFLLSPWLSSNTAPYTIRVDPGSITVPRGSDVRISAGLENFVSEEVELVLKRGDEEWDRISMLLDQETGEFSLLVFDLSEEAQYFVESSGVRSELYQIDVVDLPYVSNLDLEYHYPEYTGLSPRRVEDGGDIAALRDTRVEVEVTPTIPVSLGKLVIDGRDSLDLTVSPDGSLRGSLMVEQDGLYRIAFPGPNGTLVDGSPDYVIEALEDQPPAVSIVKPRRDVQVTNVDEVFVEVEAEDDYGIRDLELVYSVNGGEEQSVVLKQRSSRKSVSIAHTFYLEEWELEPGDFISYFARVKDNRQTRQQSTTDIYFVEIRPFSREFRQADSQGAMSGAGGMNNGLSERQRQIVAGTFNLVRDEDRYSNREIEEHLVTLALAQGRLREEVEILVRRMATRGVTALDSGFAKVAEALPLALEEMEVAERLLGEEKAQEALGPEQRALQHLQRAEAAYDEVQVSRGQSSSGSAGQMSEELADLFELELDRLKNQYEEVQRGERQQVDQELDETLQKLQELARRQQQEIERQRRLADQASGSAGGSRNQRQLAEETEELARRLERLAREQSLPDLEQTARRLRESADAMRRAAAERNEAGISQGLSALDQLREARKRLERDRSDRLERDVEDALRRAENLLERQERIREEVGKLDEGSRSRDRRLERLVEQKSDLANDIADLENDLDRMAAESRREQPEASQGLSEAARSIRDNKLKEKVLYSRGVVQGRSREYAENFEDGIRSNLDELRDEIAEAVGSIGESDQERLSRALDQTRDAVRGLESLEERLRETGEASRTESPTSGQQESESPGRETSEAGQPRPDAAREGLRPGGGGGPPSPTGRIADGEARQLRRELRERRGELEGLREELRGGGLDVDDLDGIISRLRRMENRGAWSDPRGLAELQSQIVEDLKDFEYRLRQELRGDREQLYLSGSDEVPPDYRELVEEYYRSLSRDGTR